MDGRPLARCRSPRTKRRTGLGDPGGVTSFRTLRGWPSARQRLQVRKHLGHAFVRQLPRRDRRHLARAFAHDAEKLVVIPRERREPRARAASGAGTVTRLAHALEGELTLSLCARL